MGGSGGGIGAKFGDPEEFRRRIREELERASGKKKNVFISFAMEDKGEVELLRGQSSGEFSDIEFNDWSVKKPFDSEDSEYIRRKISERIQHSSATIVYLSKDNPNSKWVKWEVKQSLKLGKEVIAVHKGDKKPNVIPSVVKDNEHVIKIIPWAKLAEILKNIK